MAPHPSLPSVEHLTFHQISQLNYKEQACWFLNGFWDADQGDLAHHAERVWSWHTSFVKLDLQAQRPRGHDGSELDQVLSAKFLEDMEQTLTSLERKAALQEIDVNNDGKMALVEYLMYVFKKDAQAVVVAQQGKAQEIKACQHIIDCALGMLPEIKANLKAQREAQREVNAALKTAKAAKAEAEAALAVQMQAEKELREALQQLEMAKAELQAAVDELQRQEEFVQNEMARLQAIAEDASCGIVSKGKAANQLNALHDEDPMPLRKAKITQEAALRAVEKRERAAVKKHAEASAKMDICRCKFEEQQNKELELEARQAELDAAIHELEASYAEMNTRMSEAQAAIEELKKQTCGLGAVWWMERELYEADESLPRSKQKYDHSKPLEFAAAEPATDSPNQSQHKLQRKSYADSPAPATVTKAARKNVSELAAMLSG